MIVVADTGPLNYLIRLGREGLLEALYGRVILPRAVLNEMLHPRAPSSVRTWAMATPEWAECREVLRPIPNLDPWLDAGESAAISLAEELFADLVLMDETRARRAALARGVKVGGTLSILALGTRRGLANFEVDVTEMQKMGFCVSDELVQQILTELAQ